MPAWLCFLLVIILTVALACIGACEDDDGDDTWPN